MNASTLVIISVIALFIFGSFFGVIKSIQKSFSPAPDSSTESKANQEKHAQFIDTTERDHQKLMDNMRQKMEDHRRGF